MRVLMKRVVGIIAIGLFISAAAPEGMAEEVVKLSVDEAVKTALKENLGLRLDNLQAESAEGARVVEEGAFDTAISASGSGAQNRQKQTTSVIGTDEKTVDWNAGVTKKFQTGTELGLNWTNQRFETDLTNFLFSTINPSYKSSLELSVQQPLWKGFGPEKQTYALQAAESDAAGAALLAGDKAAALAADVRRAYWELVFAVEDASVRELSLKLARSLSDETREKIQAGVLAPVEIHQPEAEVARREELLIQGQRNVGNSEDALKLLLNVSEWSVSIVPADRPEDSAPMPEMAAVLEKALSARQDMKAADEGVRAATLRRKLAEDIRNPGLALVGGVGLNGLGDDYGAALDDISGGSYYNWRVGLEFQMPIENRAARGGVIQAKAGEETARIQAESLRQEIIRQAREAVRNVHLATKAVDAAVKSSLAFEKRLEAEQAKFEVGLSTTNDVLQAQEEYALALVQQQRAMVDLAISRSDLDRVQGVTRVKAAEPEEEQ